MTTAPKQDKQVNLRISQELHKEITEQAKECGLSANQWLVNAVKEKLNRQSGANTGSIITGTITDNISTVVSSTVTNSFHEGRLTQLEEQMTRVMEVLGLDPKPLPPVASVSAEILDKDDSRSNSTSTIDMVDAPVTHAVLPQVPITLAEVAEKFFTPDAGGLAKVLAELEDYKRCGIADDVGNDWDYVPQEDRWIPTQYFAPYLRSKAVQKKAKAREKVNRKTAKTDQPVVAQVTTATVEQSWEAIATAQRKFTEMTGLEATPTNGISIRNGYFLGGTLTFKQEKDWIALVDRLAIATLGIPQPVPATLDKADAIYRVGGEYTIPAPPKWARG